MNKDTETSGKIIRTRKDGVAVLWSFVPELPNAEEQASLPTLVVIAWAYDGSENDGMPNSDTNQQMLAFEQEIGILERPGFCVEAYRRIGNGLREFVYYVSDFNQYIHEFNQCLRNHPTYPIDIKFYNDSEWLEFRRLLEDFDYA